MDIQEQDRSRAQAKAMAKDRRRIVNKVGKESTIDPAEYFSLLPLFLVDAYNISLQSYHQRLTTLLTAVPTSDTHQTVRKLQASGHGSIARKLRNVFQQEEAIKVSKFRPQSRGQSVFSSRPGTASNQTLQFNAKKNLVSLSEQLHANQAAMKILMETKPKPTERDREHLSSKITHWSAPRKTNKFIHHFKEVIGTFITRSRQSIERNDWYDRILAHQEERVTHAIGDRDTLIKALHEFRQFKKNTFYELDKKINNMEKEQNRFGRGSIQLETDFENDVQDMWEKNASIQHHGDTKTVQLIIENDEIIFENLVSAHRTKISSLQKQIKRVQMRTDEQNEESDKGIELKNKEIQNEIELHNTIKLQIMRMKEEIVEKEWLQKKTEEMEKSINDAVNMKVKEYQEEDAIKRLLLLEKQQELERLAAAAAAAAAEAEAAAARGTIEKNDVGEKPKKKGKTRKKTKT
jgi:hypothetical protein